MAKTSFNIPIHRILVSYKGQEGPSETPNEKDATIIILVDDDGTGEVVKDTNNVFRNSVDVLSEVE